MITRSSAQAVVLTKTPKDMVATDRGLLNSSDSDQAVRYLVGTLLLFMVEST